MAFATRIKREVQRERVGLLLVLAPLVVVVFAVGLVLYMERETRIEQVRAQGIDVARILSRLPYEQLVGRSGEQSALRLVQTNQRETGFAYGAVVDLRGTPLAEVADKGLIAPPAAIPVEPSGWSGERAVDDSRSGRGFREFFAPVVVGGERIAHLRIGYYEPSFAAPWYGSQRLALLALAIFALAPFSYLLLRRETMPLRRVTEQFRPAPDGELAPSLDFEATGQLGEFVGALRHFVSESDQRFHALERDRDELLASSRVLHYEKKRMLAVLEALPFASFIMDEAGAVSFVNSKLEGFVAKPLAEVLGQRPETWTDHDGIVEFLAPYGRGRGAAPPPSRSIELAFGDHGDRHLSLSAHPVANNEAPGAASGTLVLLRDTTGEAVHSRTQGEFITHVAHELKTPLSVFLMYAELLIGEDGASAERRVEACNAIQDEAERLGELVDTLLAIVRIEEGATTLERSRVKVADFLRDAVDNVGRARGTRAIGIELELPSRAPTIRVDKNLFRIALNNLLTNAIKYNRDDGSVTVVVEDSEETLTIRVRDTGVGIEEQELSRVFDKFYRSERDEIRDRPGHGLGLALVKEIVELHGGVVQVQSALGKGTEFAVVLRKTALLLGEGE